MITLISLIINEIIFKNFLKNYLVHHFSTLQMILLMKKLLIFFLLVLSCHAGSANGNWYGYDGNRVFKADSAGNTIWVQDFSGMISPSSHTNVVGYVFEVNYRVYIGIFVTDTSSTGTQYVNTAVLDTNGLVLSIKYNIYIPSSSITWYEAIPSSHSGVWLLFDYQPGHTHHLYIIKVDSMGDWSWSTDVFQSTYNDLHDFETISDSTFIVLSRSYGSGTDDIFTLTKLKENGEVLWCQNFCDSLYNAHIITPECITTDSIGNFYVLGRYSDWPNPLKTIGIKIDPNGSILYSRLLPVYFLNPTNIKVFNGAISFDDGGHRFYLDTLFNNYCFGNSAQVSIIPYMPSYYINNISSPGTPVAFTPVVGNAFVVQRPVIYIPPDSCFITDISKHPENKLIAFPNPTSSRINIQFDELVSDQIEIALYDFTGRKQQVYSEINGKYISCDVGNLVPGIYSIILSASHKIYSGSFIRY
jgi:hypothetical protein